MTVNSSPRVTMQQTTSHAHSKRSRLWLVLCLAVGASSFTPPVVVRNPTQFMTATTTSLSAKDASADVDAEEVKQRMKDAFFEQQTQRLERMEQSKQKQQRKSPKPDLTPVSARKAFTSENTQTQPPNSAQTVTITKEQYLSEKQTLYDTLIIKSANALKDELIRLKLHPKGRKPDLANRIVTHYFERKYPHIRIDDDVMSVAEVAVTPNLNPAQEEPVEEELGEVTSFAGLTDLSDCASQALTLAGFQTPSPIQVAALPRIAAGDSLILHAETGSGKTLAYLLAITESLWNGRDGGICLIVTPTRELASQFAGVASALSPPNAVRLVDSPMNLCRVQQSMELEGSGGRVEKGGNSGPRIIVGSAKSIHVSLFGDGKLPAPPTPKPLAQEFLKGIRWLVLDEVDRLLNAQSRNVGKKVKHDKPAAVLTSIITKLTYGKCQIIAGSATVGRPLKRELSRVLGLPSKECPDIVRGDAAEAAAAVAPTGGQHIERAVTIPSGVKHYYFPVKGNSFGSLLTSAAMISRSISSNANSNSGTTSSSDRKILVVLSSGCNFPVHEAVGALTHLNAHPNTKALLDALEADHPDKLIQVHRELSQASGLGNNNRRNGNVKEGEGYLLVTSEDNVRGLHLDGLDTVIVVGRPKGPDEYVHIAGRTGRAGSKGNVITVVGADTVSALTSWETILGLEMTCLDKKDGEALSLPQ